MIDVIGNLSYFVALPAGLTFVVLLLLRQWRRSSLALVILLIGLWPIRWTLLSPSPVAADPAANDIRILVANIYGQSAAIDAIAQTIAKHQPDAAIIIEVGPGLERMLVDHRAIADAYPFALTPAPQLAWRTILLSRHPMHTLKFSNDREEHERFKFVFAFRRSVFVDSPAGRFLLSAEHCPSPRTAQTWARGNSMIDNLIEVSQRHLLKAGVPVVLGGDFNTTPSGWRFRAMADRSGLRPSDELGGIDGTWPSDLPGWMRLTIDRVWVSPEVQFISREVLEDVHSDHRPILVTLRLPAPAERFPSVEQNTSESSEDSPTDGR